MNKICWLVMKVSWHGGFAIYETQCLASFETEPEAIECLQKYQLRKEDECLFITRGITKYAD